MKNFNEHNQQTWDFNTGQELHGDVIIERIEALPSDFDKMKPEPMDALAYGESTGHLHKLFRMTDETIGQTFQLRIADDGVKYLKVDEPCVLKHQEHEPRVIPAGLYRIGIQRQYDPFTKLISRVVD